MQHCGVRAPIPDASEAFRKGRWIAPWKVGAADAAVAEHEVAGEENTSVRIERTAVVTSVTGGVHDFEAPVAERDPVTIREPAVDRRAGWVPSDGLHIEGRADGLDVAHVIVVGVRDEDTLEPTVGGTDAVREPRHDVEVRPHVDQCRLVSRDVEHVAREDRDVRSEVLDHGRGACSAGMSVPVRSRASRVPLRPADAVGAARLPVPGTPGGGTSELTTGPRNGFHAPNDGHRRRGGRRMGKVAAQLKVMPDDPDADLDALQDRLESSLPEGAKINGFEREDVAFGLVALLPTVIVPDDAGGTEAVEEAFSGLEEIESVSVESVGRV
jgi:elongation factor 1-beta